MALADERPCRLNVLAPFDQNAGPQACLEDERPDPPRDFWKTRGQRQTLGLALADERPEADFRSGTWRREALQVKCSGPL